MAAHVWRYGWRFCAFPSFQTGSLLGFGNEFGAGDFVITQATLRDPAQGSFKYVPIKNGFKPCWRDEMIPPLELEVYKNCLAFECVLRGEPERLEKLSMDDLSATKYPCTVFHYAAALGAADCLEVLIRRFVDVPIDCQLLTCCDARFPFGSRQDVLGVLMRHANLNAQDHSEGLQSIVNSAAYFGFEEMLSFLMLCFDLDPSSALLHACEKGHTDCARRLLEKHAADANTRDDQGRTPLMVLLEGIPRERGVLVSLLLEHGADPNVICDAGFTPLMMASGANSYTHELDEDRIGSRMISQSNSGRADCTRRLLEYGADVNARSRGGTTSLIWASCYNHADCVHLLLEHGADPNATSHEGWTALAFASRTGFTDSIQLLMEHGADVNAASQRGWTTLMLVSRRGFTDYARFLLEHGADVNAASQDGGTPLMVASQHRQTDCARLLLEHGASVNAVDENGDTALMRASGAYATEEREPSLHPFRSSFNFKFNADCARLLLEHGADVNSADGRGVTALMFASRDGHAGCARLLLEHGADVNSADGRGVTALMFASRDGRAGCARLLLEHGADAR